jgi:hypothetical protein
MIRSWRIAVIVAAAWACKGYHTETPPIPVTNAASPQQRDSVLAYARRQKYDSTTHGAADRQLLTIYDSSSKVYQVGPVGTIYPESGAARNDYADLGGRGRVIGSISVDSPYPKLGLHPGVSYVWVDSLTIYGDTGRGRAIIIADTGWTQPVVLPLFYLSNDGKKQGPAVARWLFRPKDEAGWFQCTKTGCCAIGVSTSAGLNLQTGLFTP